LLSFPKQANSLLVSTFSFPLVKIQKVRDRQTFNYIGYLCVWGLGWCTSRTVPGSIPGCVTGFFSDIFLPTVSWPWGRLIP